MCCKFRYVMHFSFDFSLWYWINWPFLSPIWETYFIDIEYSAFDWNIIHSWSYFLGFPHLACTDCVLYPLFLYGYMFFYLCHYNSSFTLKSWGVHTWSYWSIYFLIFSFYSLWTLASTKAQLELKRIYSLEFLSTSQVRCWICQQF